MGDVNQILGVEGSGVKFTAATGKEYTFHEITPKVQAKFEAWVEHRALTNARKFHADERVAIVKDVHQKMTAGAYSWNGEECSAALNSPLGLSQMRCRRISGTEPGNGSAHGS